MEFVRFGGTHPLGCTQQPDELAGASLMPGFIQSSPAMTRLVEEVHKILSSDVTVLVTGESGTGKELVARAIHALSSRRAKVFVPFNCTAVPKELSEGYLFGYRRGAFTGAVTDSQGVIRTAAGGTLFLDEIGDLPLDLQPKLLRFLQEGEIQPLGEQRPIKVDVRIIAATNSDLEEMVAQGRFREESYYSDVIRLRVPPLRERRSEIPTIVNYYINHYSAKFGRKDIQITPPAVDLLMVCDWPGNVRQLCNEIQRIVARAEEGAVITPEQLSPELKRTSAPVSHGAAASTLASMSSSSMQNVTLADAFAEVEGVMISEALRKHGGNISRAARELGTYPTRPLTSSSNLPTQAPAPDPSPSFTRPRPSAVPLFPCSPVRLVPLVSVLWSSRLHKKSLIRFSVGRLCASVSLWLKMLTKHHGDTEARR